MAISPQDGPTEYVLAGIIMLMGASLYAFIIGSIASLLNSIQAAKNRHWERIESVTEFLRDQKVPADTQRGSPQLLRARVGAISGASIVTGCSTTCRRRLRLKVLLHLTESIRQTVPLFRHSLGPATRCAAYQPRVQDLHTRQHHCA